MGYLLSLHLLERLGLEHLEQRVQRRHDVPLHHPRLEGRTPLGEHAQLIAPIVEGLAGSGDRLIEQRLLARS